MRRILPLIELGLICFLASVPVALSERMTVQTDSHTTQRCAESYAIGTYSFMVALSQYISTRTRWMESTPAWTGSGAYRTMPRFESWMEAAGF